MSFGKPSFDTNRISRKKIQKMFFRTQLILIGSLALMLGAAGILINFHFEREKRDQNLQNVAETIARLPILTEAGFANPEDREIFSEYLDALHDTLEDIDVISVVNKAGIRIYHSNHALIGTQYDGRMPNFEAGAADYYAVDETGPSGNQRRAYAGIYSESGKCVGFVMAIMLTENIMDETARMLTVFLIITLSVVLVALIIAGELSKKVKKSLMGYEPDVFTAMYKMRDTILETLTEGIVAFDADGLIQFANESAKNMLCRNLSGDLVGQNVDSLGNTILSRAVKSNEKKLNINLSQANIILDLMPIREDGHTIGTIAILHNRAEYRKLMEELSGTRYLVDSMRANNHDFTNKLHVILGLIQMELYDDACSYIQNITMVHREKISKLMNTITDPAVAALLIGKISRASELNVNFVLREGCHYSAADMNLPSEMLITVIGNLLDNAFDAMNKESVGNTPKELMFGIYSSPGAVLISVDDTGSGIKPEDMCHIFENGFSTKGKNRGTGLYQVKSMVESFGGKITVESQEGVGSSFSVSFAKEEKNV